MSERQAISSYRVDKEEAERACARMSDLDTLAFDASIADCQAQGIIVSTKWHRLNPLTQKRYRAIAHQIRMKVTDGQMTTSQFECSLIANLSVMLQRLVLAPPPDVTRSFQEPDVLTEQVQTIVVSGVIQGHILTPQQAVECLPQRIADRTSRFDQDTRRKVV